MYRVEIQGSLQNADQDVLLKVFLKQGSLKVFVIQYSFTLSTFDETLMTNLATAIDADVSAAIASMG